jgi:hypothetical protein
MVPMATNQLSTSEKSYHARLRGGPDDGTDMIVGAASDGEPPEFLHAIADDTGMYLLAGLPNPDGSMPYWWVPSQQGAVHATAPGEATWTLISLADDGATKLWHQHGEDSEPVQLVAEPVKTADLPTHIGRAYSCPNCDDTAVLSRPIQVHGSEDTMSMDPARRVN